MGVLIKDKAAIRLNTETIDELLYVAERLREMMVCRVATHVRIPISRLSRLKQY